MTVKYYQDLLVWQKAMDLAVMIYELTRKLPREERFSLADQMRRASVSIPSNIAEGQQRKTTKEFIQFLFVSKGSLAEIETQLILCMKLSYLNQEQIEPALQLCGDIGRMINALISRLQKLSTSNDPKQA